MSKKEEVFERILVSSLSRAIDFVRFAETKNAALLTFASAWILAITALIFSKNFPMEICATMAMAWVAFVCVAAIAIWSLLPKIYVKMLLAGEKNSDAGATNLLYFEHIGSLTMGDLLGKMQERYHSKEEERHFTNEYLRDISQQIGANSRIAGRKFRLFNIGACIVLVIFVSLVPLAFIMSFLAPYARCALRPLCS